MESNAVGFIEVTKLAARDAFVGYFSPIVAVVRWFQPLWLTVRFATLEYRTFRDTRGLRASVRQFVQRVRGEARGAIRESVTVETSRLSASEAEITVLRALHHFVEEQKHSRIRAAVAAHKVNDAGLRRQLFLELQLIEAELVEVSARLGRASYQRDLQSNYQFEAAIGSTGQADTSRTSSVAAFRVFEDAIKALALTSSKDKEAIDEIMSVINGVIALGMRKVR